MRPRFEDPIDTAQDLVDNNITVFDFEGLILQRKRALFEFNITEYTTIAENMVSVKDWDEYYQFIDTNIMEAGTHAIMDGYISYSLRELYPMEKWWKSKEVIPLGNPYGTYSTNRKWIFLEVFFCK